MAQLIIGLGNPGGEYANTRHNVGWMCLDEVEAAGRFAKAKKDGPIVVREGSLDGFEVVTARPQTYMNLSGKAGDHLLSKFSARAEDVIVVHDDIDLPLGRLRIRRGGSAGGQKGVQSLITAWRTQDFVRIRIGVGRPDGKDEVVDHVLGRFTPDERNVVNGSLRRASGAVRELVTRGLSSLEPIMTEYNRA